MSLFSCLVGKRVRAVRLEPGGATLAVQVQSVSGENWLYFSAHGDCCSESFIESIAGLEEVRGHTILSAVDVPEGDGRFAEHHLRPTLRQESKTFYAFEARSLAGVFSVEMRNESNGYYGGWLSLDVSRDGEPPDDWKRISEPYAVTAAPR